MPERRTLKRGFALLGWLIAVVISAQETGFAAEPGGVTFHAPLKIERGQLAPSGQALSNDLSPRGNGSQLRTVANPADSSTSQAKGSPTLVSSEKNAKGGPALPVLEITTLDQLQSLAEPIVQQSRPDCPSCKIYPRVRLLGLTKASKESGSVLLDCGWQTFRLEPEAKSAALGLEVENVQMTVTGPLVWRQPKGAPSKAAREPAGAEPTAQGQFAIEGSMVIERSAEKQAPPVARD